MNEFDVCVIGSGMGSLTAACLLAKEGLRVGVMEQNYLPGGCTSSYWRKGFVFESGATTLVGLDKQMPLDYLLKTIDVDIPAIELELPMQVHLKDGTLINRYKALDEWIGEAERVFGKENQRPFWEFCYDVSQFVWETSLLQTSFPPSSFSDLLLAAQRASFKQVKYARHALVSMKALLKKFNLLQNTRFIDFINEQLLITAQNYLNEVNVLFGATALCYTNYANYYVNGGLINLVNPLVHYLEGQGSKMFLRTGVKKIEKQEQGYRIDTVKSGSFTCRYLVSGLPLNNTLELFKDSAKSGIKKKVMKSAQLNSAFQMGIGFKKKREFDTIHHQIHLPKPLPESGSHSIFLSLNHPSDTSRTDGDNQMVASVSTHVPNPAHQMMDDKTLAEQAIIEQLEHLGFLAKEDIIYHHSSTPSSWFKWTRRYAGFVGGYPQYMRIKPWQMMDVRLDGKGAYICGDTTYPGQGIPGVTLSGIIAFEKLKRDHFS